MSIKRSQQTLFLLGTHFIFSLTLLSCEYCVNKPEMHDGHMMDVELETNLWRKKVVTVE